MRLIYIISVLVLVLSGCTSTRRLSNKFSEKPAVIYRQFSGASYANNSGQNKSSLWISLSQFRQDKEGLPPVGDDALIQLTIEKSKKLTVTAFQEQQQIASFYIPVRQRGKYLILKNKTRIIPIPILFFNLKEHKAILAPLENGSIGYYGYRSETLMILFMGATNESNYIHEHQPVEQEQ